MRISRGLRGIKVELILKDIQKSFENKVVLKGMSFTFQKGNIYGLLGRNGAGKTTLFNYISGEMEKEKGQVILHSNLNEQNF